MAKLQRVAGSTAVDINIFVNDSSVATGAGLTGLAYNTGSLVAYYHRQGAASAVAITLATKTLGTWVSGGFVVVDATNMPGAYELGIPDAALAAGAKWVLIMLKGAANMAPVVLEIELTAVDNQDSVRGGMTALPNVAAAANGGLPTGDANNAVKVQSGTGANQISLSSGLVTLAGVTHTGAVIPTVTTTTTATNLTNAPTNGDLTNAMKSSVTAAVPTVAAIAAGVWDRLTSALTTAGSIGKLIVDNLNATITSRMATFSYTAPPTVGDIEAQLSGVHGSGAWSTATGFATPSDVTTATASLATTTNVSAINTKLGTPTGASVSADIAALLVQILAILDDTGTSGVALSTAVKQAIADEVLKRGASNVDGSADYNSLYELIQTAINATLPTGSTTLTIYETDGTTVFNTRDATLDEDALPVVGIQ